MNYRDLTLDDWIDHINGKIEDETTLDGNEMRDLVKFLTTMQEPKTGWIPVSERLPETDDDVLVCDGIDMFVAWYAWKGMWQGWNSHDNSFERDTPIIAWMPLPTPYKESEDKG